MEKNKIKIVQDYSGLDLKGSRRNFLKYTGGATVLATLVLAGCKDDNDSMTNNNGNGVNLGSGDVGILNYAYALEQLEAAFYLTVVDNFSQSDLSSAEKSVLDDLSKHEVAHREFFKKALGTNAIADLEVDFSSIDFSSRTSILATAKAFEDLGVAAYNGAGKYIQNADYLVAAGEIVSVEARHASTIRDLINPMSMDFAGSDVVDSNGLDQAMEPADVLNVAGNYVKTKIDASNLPS